MKKLAVSFDIGEYYQLGETENVASRFPTLSVLISSLLKNVYVLAGIIFFFLLIGGGFMIIVNAGKNNPEAVGKGQKAVTAAVIGLLVIFASYWIIQLISKVTGLNILTGEGL